MPRGMITVVAFQTIAVMVLRRLVAVVGLGPSRDAKDVELAVLHHQLAVLHRQVARPRYRPADRMVLAWLASLLPRERWSVFLVTPGTLLRWHRELVAHRWTYRHTGARRGLDPQTIELARTEERRGIEAAGLATACGGRLRRSAVQWRIHGMRERLMPTGRNPMPGRGPGSVPVHGLGMRCREATCAVLRRRRGLAGAGRVECQRS
jgi:putative transposase